MKYIYKITGKVSLILYIFMLYQFWHLCQYGGLRRHIPMLALGIIGLVGTVVLWLISKKGIIKKLIQEIMEIRNFSIRK